MRIWQRIVYWFDSALVKFKGRRELSYMLDALGRNDEPEAEKCLSRFFALSAKHHAKYR